MKRLARLKAFPKRFQLVSVLLCWGVSVYMPAVGLASGSPSVAPKFHVPEASAPIIDQAQLLNPETVRLLDNALMSFRNDGGAQIAVLAVPDLGGLPIEQASIEVADKWKLGGKGKDDGVVVLIAKAERQARIEVGRGLEGEIPDAIAKRIVSDVMTPRFGSGDFDGGLRAGLYQIAHASNPNMDARSYFGGRQARLHSGDDERRHVPIGLLFFFLPILILISIFGRGGGYYGGGFGGGLGGGGFGGGFGGGGGSWGGGGGGFNGGGASGGW